MYPFLRLGLEYRRARRLPPLDLFGTHVSRHTCLPWDIDPWMELNNGRTLTLFDLGRVPFARRLGLDGVLRAKGWGMAVAGSSVRYRRRVRAFHRLEMQTRLIVWDARFIYIEQSLWRHGDCTSHILIRSAVTGSRGIVPPADLIGALGHAAESPALPPWAAAWVEADAARPWPPARTM